MILYVNCCARTESRTERIAKALLHRLGGEYTELKLYDEDILPMTEETLQKRSALIEAGKLDDPMLRYARQFAEADKVVISAPYWDLSFPSKLKIYLENVYAVGVVSKYAPDGTPVGLCKADCLYYVTTAGGKYNEQYSFGYIKEMATDFFGIKEAKLIKAEMLDIEGFSAEDIVSRVIRTMEI